MTKYIDHYDQVSNLVFEIPEFDAENFATFADFLEANRAAVQEAIFSALCTAFELKLTVIPVFTIKNTESVISIDESQFEEKTKLCLDYLTEVEEYEACAELVRLKSHA